MRSALIGWVHCLFLLCYEQIFIGSGVCVSYAVWVYSRIGLRVDVAFRFVA